MTFPHVPDLPPGPLSMNGEGEEDSLTHTPPGETRKPQASQAHEMRPLGRISGGVGGQVPPQKKQGDRSPHKKTSPNPTKHQAKYDTPSLTSP